MMNALLIKSTNINIFEQKMSIQTNLATCVIKDIKLMKYGNTKILHDKVGAAIIIKYDCST